MLNLTAKGSKEIIENKKFKAYKIYDLPFSFCTLLNS